MGISVCFDVRIVEMGFVVYYLKVVVGEFIILAWMDFVFNFRGETNNVVEYIQMLCLFGLLDIYLTFYGFFLLFWE